MALHIVTVAMVMVELLNQCSQLFDWRSYHCVKPCVGEQHIDRAVAKNWRPTSFQTTDFICIVYIYSVEFLIKTSILPDKNSVVNSANKMPCH